MQEVKAHVYTKIAYTAMPWWAYRVDILSTPPHRFMNWFVQVYTDRQGETTISTRLLCKS